MDKTQEILGFVFTGGLYGDSETWGYIFEHDETGKRVLVYAGSERRAGEKLADGDYHEIDDD